MQSKLNAFVVVRRGLGVYVNTDHTTEKVFDLEAGSDAGSIMLALVREDLENLRNELNTILKEA